MLDSDLLDLLSASARSAPRLRKNLNLHTLESEPVQRLFNAIEPDSYVMPHRHLDAHASETLIAVRGRFGVIEFDHAGQPTRTVVLQAGGPTFGIHLPSGVWHSLVALEHDSALFEVKQGPYRALDDAERATWAPADGTASARQYHAWMRSLFPTS